MASVSIAGVQELASLGQGYLIIKVAPAMLAGAEQSAEHGPHALLVNSLPEIPISQVKLLLATFAESIEEQGVGGADVAVITNGALENRSYLSRHATQAAAARAQHLADGSLLTPAELWRRLNISRQAVSKAVKEQRMFALDGPAGQQLYPAFFCDPGYDRRDLEKVSQALGDLPGPSKWQFFTTGKISLGGKMPLDALANGDMAAVLVAAAAFRER